MTTHHLDERLGARGRLTVGALVLLATALLVPGDWATRFVAGWDAGVLVMLALAWAIILASTPERTRRRANREDPGRQAVFAIVLVSSLVSLAVAVLVLARPSLIGISRTPWLEVLAVLASLESWLLTHTTYTLRYAHLYYLADDTQADTGGLGFPGEDRPDDLDFAYFALTVGMAFQVSDVTVQSREMRRTVLWHALQAYAYNTVILGLTLSVVFGAAAR